MGCGASTSVSTQQHPQQGVGASNHGGNQNLRKAAHSVSPNQPPIKEPPKYSNLPPPRPPDKSREELLAGKEKEMKRMDEHAQNVSFTKSTTQDFDKFTKDSLIPEDTLEAPTKQHIEVSNHKQTKVVASDAARTQETVNDTNDKDSVPEITITKPNTDPEPPAKRRDSKEEKDAAQLLLEKYKRDTEQAQKLIEVDRMRQNITLQEKLAKRKDMKRKRELAQGMIVGGVGAVGVSLGDKALGIEDQTTIASAGQTAEMTLSSTEEFPTVDGQKTVSVGNIVTGMGKESGVDKSAIIMAEAAPQPVAPETRKETIYGDEDNIELFKDLENFAINMEQISDPETTFAVLMNDLLISQLSDLEKVRILFHWITKQNLNAVVFPANIDEDTPMGFLFSIKNDKKTYAELFFRLCSAAGLHAKVIRGYLKGVGYVPDHKFSGQNDPFRGSWNAVLVDGQWRLIDTHWGARHVIEEDGTGTGVELRTEYKYEEHYFLTNPDQLISTHFPDDADWQLLEHPLTLEQFQMSVKHWPLFYKMKLQLHEHQHGEIEAPKDGIVQLRIRMSEFALKDGQFKYDFMTKRKEKSIGSFNLANYVMQYSEGQHQVFQIHVPETGEYLLKIFGLSQKFSEDVFTNICMYQINCKKLKQSKPTPKNPANIQPIEIRPPFPDCSLPWGPPPAASGITLNFVSTTGPIISCDQNGEATFIMQVDSNEEMRLTQQLYEGGSTGKQMLENRAVHFYTSSKVGNQMVVFRLRVPRAGIYSLNLYSQQSDNDESFAGFCNYLVASYKQSKPSPPFPSVSNGYLGPNLQLCEELKLDIHAMGKFYQKHESKFLDNFGDSWLIPDDKNQVSLSFTHTVPLNIVAELGSNDGSEQQDFTDCVLIEDTGKKASIVVRPPPMEAKSPEYLLKLYIAPSTLSSGIPVVFNCFIAGAKRIVSKFHQPPMKKWGLLNSLPRNGFSVSRYRDCQALFEVDEQDEVSDPSPCRVCSGDCLAIDFAMASRLNLKASLMYYQDFYNQVETDQGQTMFTKMGISDGTLNVIFPQPGEYCLGIYGSFSAGDQPDRLFPLMQMKITAQKGSSTGLPKSFGIWTSNAVQLFEPMSANLKRNVVNKIKVFLAKIKHGGDHPTSETFHSVLLLTDQSIPVHPSQSDQDIYQWDYIPGPGEQVVSLVAQQSADDSSLAYVLQFTVTD